MRTVVICGSTILLLLIGAVFVAPRRSPNADAPPASIDKPGPDPPDPPDPPDSPDPLDRSDQPGGLAFDRLEIDLGLVPVGEARRVEVGWRRMGEGSLGVRRVETGCGCLIASGLPDVLPAGARGVLVLEVAGRASPGPFVLVVRILTDRPPDDLHHVRVRGYVGDDVVVSPPSLALAAVSPGRAIERIVTVRVPPGRAALRAARVDAVLVGLEGSVAVVEPVVARDRSAAGNDVIVTVRAPVVGGPFAGHIEVRVGTAGLWRIPIRGTVVPPR